MPDRLPLRIALTGSIAMGKSTVAQMMRDEGIAVFDADAAVHKMYARKGVAVAPVARRFPHAIVDEAVDRTRLAQLVLGDSDAIKALEAIVHPLVHDEQRRFLEQAGQRGDPPASETCALRQRHPIHPGCASPAPGCRTRAPASSSARTTGLAGRERENAP